MVLSFLEISSLKKKISTFFYISQNLQENQSPKVVFFERLRISFKHYSLRFLTWIYKP